MKREKFQEFLDMNENILENVKNVLGIYKRGNTELIGLCGLLTNDENDRELAYRFREKYWGKGFGSEITKGLINFCFSILNLDKITADVCVKNSGSVKIPEKFLNPIKDFYNQKDACMDRRYELTLGAWMERTN